jgi:hypothetical protein
MNVGELRALLEDHGDHLPVVIDDGQTFRLIDEFGSAMPQGTPVVTLLIGRPFDPETD